jgi:protein subunit release factor A
MKKKSTWIMDCDIEELLKTISHYLNEFNENMKEAAVIGKPDAAVFISDSYDKLDKLYNQFKKTRKASNRDRNSARLLIKETVKMISVTILDPVES